MAEVFPLSQARMEKVRLAAPTDANASQAHTKNPHKYAMPALTKCARARTHYQKPGVPVNLPHTSALTASLLTSLRFAAASAASTAEPPVSAAPATQHTSK